MADIVSIRPIGITRKSSLVYENDAFEQEGNEYIPQNDKVRSIIRLKSATH